MLGKKFIQTTLTKQGKLFMSSNKSKQLNNSHNPLIELVQGLLIPVGILTVFGTGVHFVNSYPYQKPV